jgi:DNA-binding GntR family transcriptional regulator
MYRGSTMSTTLAPSDAGMARAIYEGLRDEITSGQLRPGTPLSRRQIAQRYGASYSPVIEAMVRLETVGLVEAARAQMARVRVVTLETIDHDHTLREAYETQAIRLACKHATPAEIAELAAMADEVERLLASEDREQGAKLDGAFHRRIAEMSRSPVLVEELDRLGMLRLLREAWLTRPVALGPGGHHPRFVELIRNRDALAADALMREHVECARGLEVEAYRKRMGKV